ncbi:Restriction of telomere capping protein 5, partial [Quaeritorhiza haematococci]
MLAFLCAVPTTAKSTSGINASSASQSKEVPLPRLDPEERVRKIFAIFAERCEDSSMETASANQSQDAVTATDPDLDALFASMFESPDARSITGKDLSIVLQSLAWIFTEQMKARRANLDASTDPTLPSTSHINHTLGTLDSDGNLPDPPEFILELVRQIYRHTKRSRWKGTFDEPITYGEFRDWCSQNVRSDIFAPLARLCYDKFLSVPGHESAPESELEYCWGNPTPKLRENSHLLDGGHMWMLSFFLPNIKDVWQAQVGAKKAEESPPEQLEWWTLYRASRDGFSIPWKKSKSFCMGSPTCTLFEISPHPECFPGIPDGPSRFALLTPEGGGMIGFGGTGKKYNLSTDLRAGTYTHDALEDRRPSYKLTRTRPDFDLRFTVQEIEVIGLGTTATIENQKREWAFEARAAAKRSGVNLQGNDTDKLILEMA